MAEGYGAGGSWGNAARRQGTRRAVPRVSSGHGSLSSRCAPAAFAWPTDGQGRTPGEARRRGARAGRLRCIKVAHCALRARLVRLAVVCARSGRARSRQVPLEEMTACPRSSRYRTNAGSSSRRANSSPRPMSRRPTSTRSTPAPPRISTASGRSSRATELLWHKPFTQTLDESNAPFYKWFEDGELNVSYNCLDRNLANGNAEQGRDHLRGRRRHGDEGDVPRALPPRLPARERLASRWASARATACSSTCRCRSRAWSRCRPARGSARRTRWCSAASRRSRCRSASSTPAPSR